MLDLGPFSHSHNAHVCVRHVFSDLLPAQAVSGSPGDSDTGAQDTAALLQELLLIRAAESQDLGLFWLPCQAGVVPAVVRPVNISSRNPSL